MHLEIVVFELNTQRHVLRGGGVVVESHYHPIVLAWQQCFLAFCKSVYHLMNVPEDF